MTRFAKHDISDSGTCSSTAPTVVFFVDSYKVHFATEPSTELLSSPRARARPSIHRSIHSVFLSFLIRAIARSLCRSVGAKSFALMAIVWEKFPFPLPRPNEGERYRTVKGIAGVMRRLMRGPSQIFHEVTVRICSI